MTSPDPAALEAHRRACEAGEAGYTDPTSGLFVMTSAYLRKRGYCCALACRHCPWPQEVQAAAGRDPAAPAWPYPAPA